MAKGSEMVNDGNPPAPEDLDVTVEVRVVVTTVVDGAFQVLLRQRTVPPFRDSWELPGGPLQPGEGLEDAAKRELAKAAPTYKELLELSFREALQQPERKDFDTKHILLSLIREGEGANPVDQIDDPGTLDALRKWQHVLEQMSAEALLEHWMSAEALTEAERSAKINKVNKLIAEASKQLGPLWAVAPSPDRDVGSRPCHLEQFHAYGDPDPIPEDAPERVVSIGYWAIVPNLADAAMGDDVASHKLFPVAELDEVRLAFNHGQILADAIEWARDRLENTTIAASFCGTEFTISELRGVYDAVWGTKLDPGNFQRKVKQTNDFLVSLQRTNHSEDKAGRPAALWSLGSASRLNPPLSRPNPS